MVSLAQFAQWGVAHPDVVEDLGDGIAVEPARLADLASTEVPDKANEATATEWILGMLEVRPRGLDGRSPPRNKEWLAKAFEFAQSILQSGT